MTILRERMLADMQLRGLAEKTQEAYLRAVRQLAEYYGKSPDQINEEELRQYFLYLKNEKKGVAQRLYYRHLWPQVLLRANVATRMGDV